jgi:crotonobetainyl-CoA:carnitine CoA-transferase CaiB-like acyl-CoA transferase
VTSSGPLTGVRVLEMGAFIAGPFAGQLLADYGAEVIKIEPPRAGDTMRAWGVTRDGASLWWPTIARDKKSITLDLRTEAGQDVVRRLVPHVDIVIENFRPGTLDGWGLTYEALAAINPKLIVVRVSGFGQTGPFSDQPGFGSVAEAFGGVRFTTGSPDRPSARTGISLGDSLAALFAVIGASTALHERSISGRGQEVDVAIYEAVMALMESSIADFDLEGVLRQRTGAVLPGVAPSNAYPCADGVDVIIAGNADAVFRRLASAMERPDLANDDRYATHQARGANAEELDKVIADWTLSHTHEQVIALLRNHGVPVGPINNAETLLSDEHVADRDMIIRRQSRQGWNVPMTGIVPKFSRTPGEVKSAGPSLGEHTVAVLRDLVGLSDDELASLEAAQVI